MFFKFVMEYKELISLRKSICNNYLETYVKKGYIINPSLPLDNKDDITLDYTTCTICTAKKNIIDGKIGQDYVMVQPALRNTHINNLGSINTINQYFSYFTMIGGFHYYSSENYEKDLSEVVKTEFSFFKRYVDDVTLTIPIQYSNCLNLNDECIDYLKDNKCKLVYSTNDEENLRWKYGMKGIVGYGTRWELSNGGDLVNFGNTINIYKNGKPVGIDFGGGLESLIYSYKKLKSCIYANETLTDECRDFCEESSINEKIIDCIVSSMCIIASKDSIIARDRVILDKYMRILHSLSFLQDIPKERILGFVSDIVSQEIEIFKNEHLIEKFKNYYDVTEDCFSVIVGSKNIDEVIKLVDLCYNEYNPDWAKNKLILLSGLSKYFTNLYEANLLAIKKERKLILERREKND